MKSVGKIVRLGSTSVTFALGGELGDHNLTTTPAENNKEEMG